MESKQKRTALVTGGSSGIGRCTVAALSKAGYIVYEFSRRDVPVEGVKHMCVDVTDEASVQEAVGQILLERGSIEILVNCAGFGISGAVEFTELKQAKAQFDVNFFGTVNVSRAVLPSMRLILGTKKEASLRFYFRKPASYQIFNYFPMIYRKTTYTARITYTGIMIHPIKAPMMTLNAANPSVAVVSIPLGIRISRILCVPNGNPAINIHQNQSV